MRILEHYDEMPSIKLNLPKDVIWSYRAYKDWERHATDSEIVDWFCRMCGCTYEGIRNGSEKPKNELLFNRFCGELFCLDEDDEDDNKIMFDVEMIRRFFREERAGRYAIHDLKKLFNNLHLNDITSHLTGELYYERSVIFNGTCFDSENNLVRLMRYINDYNNAEIKIDGEGNLIGFYTFPKWDDLRRKYLFARNSRTCQFHVEIVREIQEGELLAAPQELRDFEGLSGTDLWLSVLDFEFQYPNTYNNFDDVSNLEDILIPLNINETR